MDAPERTLVEELLAEDSAITAAQDELRNAQMKYQIAQRKYVAIRDLALFRLGEDPYSNPPKWGIEAFPSGGRFRFYDMGVGEAVTAVLKESQRPMSVNDLAEHLNRGGAYTPPRNLNAALLQTKGVRKTEDGDYIYQKEEGIDLDDIPFEG